MKKRQMIGVVLLVAVIAGATTFLIRSSEKVSSDKLQVMTSFYPLQYFTQQIAGDKADVSVITPPGVEPHDYESSPRQLAEATTAKLFVYNGANLEPWVDKLLPELKQYVVKASDGIALRTFTEEDHDDEHQSQTATITQQDPHFWLDPVLAEQIVTNIKNGLIAADAKNADQYTKNADTLIARLQALGANYSTMLANCQSRTVITAHQAFGYLAQRYDLAVVPMSINPEQEPSPEAIATLVKAVRAVNAKYVFFETLTSPQVAKTIANEAGAQTAVFNPIEGLTSEEQQKGEDYFSIQQQNIQQLKLALTCQ